MTGGRDLGRLLRHLDPVADPCEYGFARTGGALPDGLGWFALVREDEGLTVIATVPELRAAGLAHRPGWTRITLRVESDLEAVGLTAAVAGALAREGISANMVAAFGHDHVFVPHERAEAALECLRRLQRSGG